MRVTRDVAQRFYAASCKTYGGGGELREKEFREKKKEKVLSVRSVSLVARAGQRFRRHARAFPGKLKRNNGRPAESNNTHSPRFTYTTLLVRASSGAATGEIRPQKSYRVLLGRIYITNGFIFIVFLSPSSFHPLPLRSLPFPIFPLSFEYNLKGRFCQTSTLRPSGLRAPSVESLPPTPNMYEEGPSSATSSLVIYIYVCVSVCTNTRICMAHIRNPWPVNNSSECV